MHIKTAIQSRNSKIEEGNCIIEYPKKINCKYNNLKKKIIVSNGSSLVIKNLAGKEYFTYPLEQTPFELIFDKKLLLQKIYLKNGRSRPTAYKMSQKISDCFTIYIHR